ncbi:hypothetical protein HNV11_21105 [Spirosoma taeanense]|uniref:Outer membrane protein beta-barrel domain-containing protein n=1 Tax=Spirosoma taeanense TaxID=2735870 RepID=A0A6M5YEF0_9BACT|nr:hypothetical protein [Spirosoma taeanense]QJW91700.1 hypothetical protein HNV11_21105 [Spirosoma taeanense]
MNICSQIKVGFVILMVCSRIVAAQSNRSNDSTVAKRDPYTIVVTVGGGLSYYSTHLGVPPGLEQVDVSRFGVPATVRAMWYPDHRLRLGLETGWTTMYSYRALANGQRSQVYVSAIPMLLVFSMPLAWLSGTERSLARRLSLTGGTGVYRIQSRLNYAGIVDARRYSLGWMMAGAYTQPIGRRIRVATELKWYDATATEDAVFGLQLQVVWRAFSW